jgi:hypothetical protein
MLERSAELKSLDSILNRNRRYRTQMLRSVLWLRRDAIFGAGAPEKLGNKSSDKVSRDNAGRIAAHRATGAAKG